MAGPKPATVHESQVEHDLANAERDRDKHYAGQKPLTFKAMQREVVPRWFRRSMTAVRHTYSERRPAGRTGRGQPRSYRTRTKQPRAGDDADPHRPDEQPAHGWWA